jgi:predicted ester cyclase
MGSTVDQKERHIMPIPSGVSAEARKQRIAMLFENIITLGELDLADELFHDDFYWPQFDLRGPEGVRTWVRAFRTAFPDMKDMVQEQIAEGDVVVTRLKCEGTQLGPFRGLPPSGRPAVFTAIGIDRFRGEKVIERSAHFDIVDLMRQLGHDTLNVPPVAAP